MMVVLMSKCIFTIISLFIKLKLIKVEFIHLQKPTQRNYFMQMLYECNRVVCCWGIFGTTEYYAGRVLLQETIRERWRQALIYPGFQIHRTKQRVLNPPKAMQIQICTNRMT